MALVEGLRIDEAMHPDLMAVGLYGKVVANQTALPHAADRSLEIRLQGHKAIVALNSPSAHRVPTWAGSAANEYGFFCQRQIPAVDIR